MIAETLFSVGKELFNTFFKIEERKIKNAIRVADYFADLAQVIEDTSAYLRKGVYPRGECENLRVHAEKMKDTIGKIIGEEEAGEYQKKVLEVWEIERMYGELISTDEKKREERLKVLDQAAGYFRGIAAHLRVSA